LRSDSSNGVPSVEHEFTDFVSEFVERFPFMTVDMFQKYPSTEVSYATNEVRHFGKIELCVQNIGLFDGPMRIGWVVSYEMLVRGGVVLSILDKPQEVPS